MSIGYYSGLGAVIPSPSSLTTMIRLEKHLDDVNKGRGYLSSGVVKEIAAKAISSDNFLAGSNPKAFINYNAYSTMFAYDSKARYLNAINGTVETLQRLNDAQSFKGISIEA
ncbi:MAG: hypothetical protein DCC75_02850 [Proteobacteria bacterium]|nr:MAG: hypothetical protein DCC75_02850 [Pseudomonadota bacterium]